MAGVHDTTSTRNSMQCDIPGKQDFLVKTTATSEISAASSSISQKPLGSSHEELEGMHTTEVLRKHGWPLPAPGAPSVLLVFYLFELNCLITCLHFTCTYFADTNYICNLALTGSYLDLSLVGS